MRVSKKFSLGSALSRPMSNPLMPPSAFNNCFFFLQCNAMMKRKLIWLAAASAAYGSPNVFSVTDDVLAYPQVSFPDPRDMHVY